MKLRLVLFLGVWLTLGFPAHVLAQACLLAGFAQIPVGTYYNIGPSAMVWVHADLNYFWAVQNGNYAWSVNTHANGRVITWTGSTSPNDCAGFLPLQVGAYNFTTFPCYQIAAYAQFGVQVQNALAFVDYYPWFCPGCGTKSITWNTAYYAYLVPVPDWWQYDLQGLMAHEWGHVLGLAHSTWFACTEASAGACWNRFNIMQNGTNQGETCQRDPMANDVIQMNTIY